MNELRLRNLRYMVGEFQQRWLEALWWGDDLDVRAARALLDRAERELGEVERGDGHEDAGEGVRAVAR